METSQGEPRGAAVYLQALFLESRFFLCLVCIAIFVSHPTYQCFVMISMKYIYKLLNIKLYSLLFVQH